MSTVCFDTKPDLDDQHFEQLSGETLHLSGYTRISGQLIFQSGSTLSILPNRGAGKFLVSNASGTAGWQNISISASGENVTKEICLTSHGFNVQDVLGWSGGTYNKAIANSSYDGEVLGIVSKCCNADCFDLTQVGYVSGLTSLSTNSTYFLSSATPGLLTLTEPTGSTSISKAVLVATSPTSAWVLAYPGYYVTSGSTAMGTTPAICNNAFMPNNSLYYSCDCNKLVYKDPTGGTHNLY